MERRTAPPGVWFAVALAAVVELTAIAAVLFKLGLFDH